MKKLQPVVKFQARFVDQKGSCMGLLNFTYAAFISPAMSSDSQLSQDSTKLVLTLT